MIYSTLYVSQSNLLPSNDKAEIENIVSLAQRRNQELDLTGALFRTAGRFAQILEGPEMSIRILMRSIQADERHRGIKVLSEETLPERRFSEWSLAYRGSSIFVDRHIKPLLQNLAQDQTEQLAARLTELMVSAANSEHSEL